MNSWPWQVCFWPGVKFNRRCLTSQGTAFTKFDCIFNIFVHVWPIDKMSIKLFILDDHLLISFWNFCLYVIDVFVMTSLLLDLFQCYNSIRELNSAILKSLQCLLTTAAKVVKSSCSFLTRLRHFHLLWNSDVLRENSSVKMFTISVNCSSQVFRVKYSLQILYVLMCLVYSKGVCPSSSQSNLYSLY